MIFIHIVPIKVAKKRKRLTPNCQGLISGEEKFSTSQSRSVAAARRPTTAGRRPMKTLWTAGVRIYFINMRLMRTIRMKLGRTRAKVAVALPSTAIIPSKPALWAAA